MASVRAPKITVILPVCDAADTVVRAIESIQNQTISSFELIVVDCASSDRTAEVVSRMAERDIRIELISSESRSVALARNLALDHAHGTYVSFLDATDWLDPFTLEDTLSVIENYNLELLLFGFYVDTYEADGAECSSRVVHFPSDVYLDQEEFRMEARKLFDRDMLLAVWNKLMLRSRIEEAHLRFVDTEHGSAKQFVLDYIRDIEHVGVMEEAYYHCSRCREDKLCTWDPGEYERREQDYDSLLELYEHWELDDNPQSFEMLQRRYIEQLVGCIEGVASTDCDLPVEEKRQLIGQMISTDHAQLAALVARPRSTAMRMLIAPIRRRDVNMTYSEARMLSLVSASHGRRLASLDEY